MPERGRSSVPVLHRCRSGSEEHSGSVEHVGHHHWADIVEHVGHCNWADIARGCTKYAALTATIVQYRIETFDIS